MSDGVGGGDLDGRSLFELTPRDDESDFMTMHFGHKQPADGANRWVQTVPDRDWFCYLRMYGPETAVGGRATFPPPDDGTLCRTNN